MSNQQNKLEKRFTRPQTLASAFGGLIKLFGGRASDSDILESWDKIVGPEIASVASVSGIRKTADKKFNISIAPIKQSFVLQLSYQTDEIAKKINKYFGYDAVAKITIKKSK